MTAVITDFACPCCATTGMQVFYEVRNVPVNSCIQLDTPQAAKAYPRGDIRLALCATCGFISNIAFDAGLAEYSDRYEETQGFSPTFTAFHEDLALRLIDKHDLHGKKLVEIGCGKGEFLELLCSRGENHGVGFDPSHIEGRNAPLRPDLVRFVNDFYSERYAQESGDFVCCKMTLEHIHPTRDFVGIVRRSIGTRHETIVYFLVPNATRILRDCAFEDIYYEHCSYFTAESLANLFASSGFEILSVDTEYDDQYLSIEAKPATGIEMSGNFDSAGAETVASLVEEFRSRYEEVRRGWQERTRAVSDRGGRVVLWGSGSKAVSFLTTLGLSDSIDRVVDINPYRQGHFMPSTAQPIVGPQALRDDPPALVIIMNRIYRGEIEESLAALGVTAEIAAL